MVIFILLNLKLRQMYHGFVFYTFTRWIKIVVNILHKTSKLCNLETTKRIFVLFCSILLKSISEKNMLLIRHIKQLSHLLY